MFTLAVIYTVNSQALIQSALIQGLRTSFAGFRKIQGVRTFAFKRTVSERTLRRSACRLQLAVRPHSYKRVRPLANTSRPGVECVKELL